MYDLNGNLLQTFDSILKASKISGVPRTQIYRQIKKNIFTKKK
jgi:transcriptional regulator of acetoin/glycerol metabolism